MNLLSSGFVFSKCVEKMKSCPGPGFHKKLGMDSGFHRLSKNLKNWLLCSDSKHIENALGGAKGGNILSLAYVCCSALRNGRKRGIIGRWWTVSSGSVCTARSCVALCRHPQCTAGRTELHSTGLQQWQGCSAFPTFSKSTEEDSQCCTALAGKRELQHFRSSPMSAISHTHSHCAHQWGYHGLKWYTFMQKLAVTLSPAGAAVQTFAGAAGGELQDWGSHPVSEETQGRPLCEYETWSSQCFKQLRYDLSVCIQHLAPMLSVYLPEEEHRGDEAAGSRALREHAASPEPGRAGCPGLSRAGP